MLRFVLVGRQMAPSDRFSLGNWFKFPDQNTANRSYPKAQSTRTDHTHTKKTHKETQSVKPGASTFRWHTTHLHPKTHENGDPRRVFFLFISPVRAADTPTPPPKCVRETTGPTKTASGSHAQDWPCRDHAEKKTGKGGTKGGERGKSVG